MTDIGKAHLVLVLASRGQIFAVNAGTAALIAAQQFNAIDATTGHPGQIHLKTDVNSRSGLHHPVNREFAFDLFHLKRMVVVEQLHPFGAATLANQVQLLAQLGPRAAGRAPIFRSQKGQHDHLVANRLVKGNHAIQITLQHFERDVAGTGAQAILAQQPLHLVGGQIVRTNRLDTGVTNRRDFRQQCGEGYL